jgi:hypothetical protein
MIGLTAGPDAFMKINDYWTCQELPKSWLLRHPVCSIVIGFLLTLHIFLGSRIWTLNRHIPILKSEMVNEMSFVKQIFRLEYTKQENQFSHNFHTFIIKYVTVVMEILITELS